MVDILISLLWLLLVMYVVATISVFIYILIHGRNIIFRDKRVKTPAAKFLVLLLLAILWPLSINKE